MRRTGELSAILLRDAEFFAKSFDALLLLEVATDTDVTIDDLSRAGEHHVTVETTVEPFDSAYLPWQWRGPDSPTLVFELVYARAMGDLENFVGMLSAAVGLIDKDCRKSLPDRSNAFVRSYR